MIKKPSIPPEEMTSASLEHKKEHDNVHVYTDGSEMEDWMGFAALMPSQTLNGELSGTTSVFTAAMHAIKTTIIGTFLALIKFNFLTYLLYIVLVS